jgi:hypothetical protein
MTSRTPQGPLEKASKTPRRSRTTNDPIKARHKATTSRGLRVRDLFRAFMAKLDPDGDGPTRMISSSVSG